MSLILIKHYIYWNIGFNKTDYKHKKIKEKTVNNFFGQFLLITVDKKSFGFMTKRTPK